MKACGIGQNSPALLLKVIDVDITSNDGDVLETLRSGSSINMQLLRPRIRQHRDLRQRVVLPNQHNDLTPLAIHTTHLREEETQTTPSTTQIKDL